MRYSQWANSNLDITSRSGDEWFGRCPFTESHNNNDRTPSMSVNVRKGLFVCYACGEKGRIDKLAERLQVRLIETAPTADSLRERAKSLSAGVETEQVSILPDAWLKRFTISRKVREYWCDVRGIDAGVAESFKLGYDSATNSATVPLRDINGNLLGVIRRRLATNAMPRYLYPKDFKKNWHLWGAWAAKGHDTVAVCEGSVDALSLWSIDVPAVAILGSSISKHQSTLLNRLGCRTLIICTDRDEQGVKAARDIREATSGVLVKVATYKRQWKGKDPAALTVAQRESLVANAIAIPRAPATNKSVALRR